MPAQILTASELVSHTRILGRWVAKAIQGRNTLYTTNLGSVIRFQIQNATYCTVNFLNNGNPFGAPQIIGIRVDQGSWQSWAVNQMPATIALTPVTHTIELMTIGNTDMDNVWLEQQGFALQSIRTDVSATITPTVLRQHITFIGDSITAGCWVNGHRPARDYAAHGNYAAICADQLNCDTCRIAYSAAGIIRDGTGSVPPAPQFLDHLDHDTSWHPTATDLVVVNLGVNDRQFNVSEFEPCLSSFLQQLEDTFDAPLAVMIPFAQTFAPTFRTIVPQFRRCHLVETEGWPLTYTDQLHVDGPGSVIAGTRLASILQTLLPTNSAGTV